MTQPQTQGLMPRETSRFEVIAAYWIVAYAYHSGGSSKGYRILSRCSRHLGGNLDALFTDDGVRANAAELLWKRRREIKRSW